MPYKQRPGLTVLHYEYITRNLGGGAYGTYEKHGAQGQHLHRTPLLIPPTLTPSEYSPYTELYQYQFSLLTTIKYTGTLSFFVSLPASSRATPARRRTRQFIVSSRVERFFYLRTFSNSVFPFASYASPRTRKARDREKRRKSGLLACEKRRKKKASADRAACLALYSAIRYGLQRGPMYLPSCPGLEPTRSNSAVAQTPVPVDQFLSRQSRPSSGLQRRGVASSERGWSASQSTSRARDGIDAVHRTAKYAAPRVRAHGRRGRCTLHTANLSRHIHNAARATGSFLGYYECVNTSYGRDAVTSRLSPSFTAFAVTVYRTGSPHPSRHPSRGSWNRLRAAATEVPRSRKSRRYAVISSESLTRCVLKVVILPCTPFIRYSIIGIKPNRDVEVAAMQCNVALRSTTGYRVSIRETLDVGALRKGRMSVDDKKSTLSRTGDNIGHTLVVFPLITSIRLHRRRRHRRTNDDDHLCKLQPVLNALRKSYSSETFRNNSAPRARSCVPRPGSFLPFCAEPPRNNRFRRVTLANEARAIAFSPSSSGALLRDAYCASEPETDALATDHGTSSNSVGGKFVDIKLQHAISLSICLPRDSRSWSCFVETFEYLDRNVLALAHAYMALIGLRAIDSTANAIPGRRIHFVERGCFTRSSSAFTLTNCLCVSAAAARKRVAKKKRLIARATVSTSH
ncbi:hypothetical protein DBV15_00670 [Temnothorax longispinosus]|uniref:Uncharacterized protein n=1 Tax=Temnothorax longispinosus TaxID=300112 RepID=A0A4S2KMT1_9HYME|nr:hypothetical protein DBV15_00670 [Temnothorax longispinosus]